MRDRVQLAASGACQADRAATADALHRYVDCWKAARARLLAGREEELYLITQREGNSKAAGGDWIKRDWGAAERTLITESFNRAVAADVRTVRRAAALEC